MTDMGGPWKARDNGKAREKGRTMAEAPAVTPAYELAVAVIWVASLAVGATVLMVLARGW